MEVKITPTGVFSSEICFRWCNFCILLKTTLFARFGGALLLVKTSPSLVLYGWPHLLITFLQTLRHHHGAIVAMSVDPQGKVLYTCGADSYIKYYDIDHGREESIQRSTRIV